MATAVQKITLSSSRDIPFNKLVLSQSNVRRVKAGVSIEELAEDIARRTLLQGLAATERWSAILTIVVQTPTDADRLKKNPLGLYVHALNWSKELG